MHDGIRPIFFQDDRSEMTGSSEIPTLLKSGAQPNPMTPAPGLGNT